MTVGSVVHGVGLASLSVFGLLSNILHFIKFWKSTSRDVYDWILLQCMAFNVIAVIFAFLLTPLSLFFDHHQVYSNSLVGLTHLNVFGSYVGLGGLALSTIALLLERVAMSSYPKLHSRIKSWLAFVLVLVTVILIAIIHLLEYEIVCYEGYGGDVHENLLGICSDDEMAFVTHSKLITRETGYRTFVVIQMLFTSALFPLVTVQILTFMLWRQRKISDPNTRSVVIAGFLQSLVNIFQLVPIFYEVRSVIMDSSYMEFYDSMPGWVLTWYQVSHFLAMMLPALYPWVFSGPGLLTEWARAPASGDREMLVRDQALTVEEQDVEVMNTNPGYSNGEEENN